MDKYSRSILLLFYLLSAQTLCVYGEGIGLSPVELAPIPCNDKAVEKLTRLAVTYINEDRTDGYKFALNRIANVHLHAQGPAGNVYYLDLDVLETKCHVGSPKPWKRCDIRPFMETQISGNCNTTILHTPEGFSYLYSYDCTLVPDPPEKLQQTCPTCPLLLPTDSRVAVEAARLTLTSYKRRSTVAAQLGVKKITRASERVRPVKASFVEYTVQECPEGLTTSGTCQRLTLESDTETAGFCTGSVYGDLEINPEVQISCEKFISQNIDINRPVRPQGHDWLPEPALPTMEYTFPDPVTEPQPVPSETTRPPIGPPEVPIEPVPLDPVPLDPSTVALPSDPLTSSSSESSSSEEAVPRQRQQHRAFDSSSSEEEEGGPLALRPPFNFRYQRRDRRKRQALVETKPAHTPIFLSDFPSGSSPFRSCPGPARYTTA